MQKSNSTPGSWHYNLNVEKKKRKMVIYSDGSSIVAVVPSSRDDNKKETLESMKADAALISAAPELLEALDNLLENVVFYASQLSVNDQSIKNDFDADRKNAIDKAIAAIAKAKGQ